MQDWYPFINAFAEQNQTAGGINTAEAVRSARSIACNSANGRLKIFVGGGIVAGLARVGQMVMIDHIEQIDIPIVVKIRMQHEAEQTEVAPAADFIADIEERLARLDAIFDDPDPAGPFPNIDATIRGKSESSGFIPSSNECLLDEIGGQVGRVKR